MEQQQQQQQQQQQPQQPQQPQQSSPPPGEGVAEREGVCAFRSRVASTASASTAGPDLEMSPACVSVRDMIKHYDSVAKVEPSQTQPKASTLAPPQRRQSQYTLPSVKSSFFGVNRFASLTNVRREDSEADEGGRGAGPRRHFSSGRRSSNTELSEGPTQTQPPTQPPTQPQRPFLHPSLDAADEPCCGVPAEASYQSKTTIAKTASGVRIIIDIFFDQEQGGGGGGVVGASDVIGSRVETDIPRSRILSEFQQQQTMLAATSASDWSAN